MLHQQARNTKEEENRPPAHDIGLSAKDLGQAADDNVGHRQDFDVGERADRFIDDDQKVVLVRQSPQALEVG